MLRHKGRGDERGVSVVLGAALVMGIIIAFVSAFLSTWVPGEVGRREHRQMRGVEESFRELRAVIEGLRAGEFRSVDVNMGADYSIPLLPTPRGVGTLSVTPAPIREIRIPPSDDAHVVENRPTTNFGLDNLRVASRLDNNRIRSYLKFSLENIPMGAMILEADLWLYCYKSTLENVTDVRCLRVENDNWTELTITWKKAIENYPMGAALDNLYVGWTGWFHWSAKDFVAREVTGDRWLSLGLRVGKENQDNIERYANFFSKEAVDKRPYLHVRYTTGPPIWIQTDWSGGRAPTLESGKWHEDYNRYYRGENENSKKRGEVRLENEVPLEYSWFQTTKEDFENGTSRENLDTSTSPGDVTLESATVTFGNTANLGNFAPYRFYTYVQRVDPDGRYAAPYNGHIIQWRWNPGGSTSGAKFKVFRHVTGTVWTMVGESGPVNLSPGMNTFSANIPVKVGDRIGGYTGSGQTYWSGGTAVAGYYASRTEGDIQGTSSFTEHLHPRRLPIDATLRYYRTKGTLISRVHDTKGLTSWREISWGESLHPSTDITLQVQVGTDNNPYLDNGSPDEENWTGWSAHYTNPSGELINLPKARYIQYKVNFWTTDTAHTPILHWVKIKYITSAMYKPSGRIESSVYDAGSQVDWRTISWVAKTPSLEAENKPVEAEPNPLVDWSPLVGENLSPFGCARAYDNIYENIAEELRRPWWDRSWACRRLVTVTNGGNALENYQVEIEVDYDDNMHPNFDDLRFVDNDNVTELSYWIENYNSRENAIVWVKVSRIPANDNKTFYMYYGNPGARPASDFSKTFPNALIIDGTVRTLGGAQRYDWVEIRNFGFLVVRSGSPLELFARKIIVDPTSYIYATGSGYLGGPTNRWRGRQENGHSYDGRPGAGGGRGGYASPGIPIAFDSASSVTQAAPVSSVSWSHTTGTGSDRLLLVAVGVHADNGAPTTVTSVTYGGTALTQVTTDAYTAANPQVRTYVFRLTNPATGTNTITVNFAAATLSVCGAVTYFNVHQTTPIQTSATARGSGTSQSRSVTVTGRGRRIFGHLGGHRTATPTDWTITEGAGQMNRWAQEGQPYKGRGSDKSVSAGLQSMSWTTNRTVNWVVSVVVINPASDPSDGPGGGGGAYGGSGGSGGGARGENDYPGENGSTFGDASDNSIYMGSGGGSGGLSWNAPENDPWNAGGAGGAGGGGIKLNAGVIEISGLVTADGGDGAGGMNNVPDAGSGGGGGGSGGTILIEGNEVRITGTLSARGGKGGARSRYDPNPHVSAPQGGAGGGGGGGRIKVFYGKSLDNASAKKNVAGGASGGPSYENDNGIIRENGRGAKPGEPGTIHIGTISYMEPTTSVGSEELESELVEPGYRLNWEHRVTGIELGYENYTFHIRGYSSNDGESIGVYIWMSRTNSWSFIDNLPKAPGDPIIFNIQPRDLKDYLVGDNLSIGYFDTSGDAERTIIHIDYCILEVTGQFSTEVKVYTRTGDTENAYDGSWSEWREATNGGEVPSPAARYLQYRVDLSTQRGQISPVFREITITHRKETEFGIVGFSSGHVFYPDQAYVYEGGSVILTQGEVDLTVLDPVMIRWENDRENENRIWVYANLWIIENERATLTSTGTRTIRVFCVDSRATVIPVDGPNREHVILRALSPYGDVWSKYLASENKRLNAMGYNASFDPNTLTLTIRGKVENAGVKDIYYYEHLKELVVELV